MARAIPKSAMLWVYIATPIKSSERIMEADIIALLFGFRRAKDSLNPGRFLSFSSAFAPVTIKWALRATIKAKMAIVICRQKET